MGMLSFFKWLRKRAAPVPVRMRLMATLKEAMDTAGAATQLQWEQADNLESEGTRIANQLYQTMSAYFESGSPVNRPSATKAIDGELDVPDLAKSGYELFGGVGALDSSFGDQAGTIVAHFVCLPSADEQIQRDRRTNEPFVIGFIGE
jgi:hypothetical protein